MAREPASNGDGAPRVLLTGAAGFVGSHLADRLLRDGFEVVGLDNLLTGRLDNLASASAHPRFRLVLADASEPVEVPGPFAWVLHFASPASPASYLEHPIETLRVNAEGTGRLIALARREGADFMLASSSEVYGEPEAHPQAETSWGRVDPIGARAVYQEAKRYAEAMTSAAGRAWGVPVRIARIFNAYGPRMAPDDGRAIPSFLVQALRDEPLMVHGDGTQTRAFQYIDDLVAGLRRLMDVPYGGPVNIGNPDERTIRELAETVIAVTGSKSEIRTVRATQGGARRRCPDIALAREMLGWSPVVPLEEGLALTAAHLAGVTTPRAPAAGVGAGSFAPSTGA